MIKADNLHLKLGHRQILSGVDVELHPGKVTAVLGPNGAGKTSLLRLLSGEWVADRGTITVNGKSLQEIPIGHLGKIRAYLHQESSLDFAFTVLEVVLLGRSPHMPGSERPIDYQIARKALAKVDLDDREDDLYTTLSGGEKQRVHLARVLAQVDEESINESRHLFLDEPTNNLDLAHQQTIYTVVRELAQAGIAVCMVVHDLNQAIQVADSIIVLEKGRVALAGKPRDIAESRECDRIFGVELKRIQIAEDSPPYLLVRGP